MPVRNQVIITEPAPRLWNFGLSTNHGYEYFMQRPDGRIVLHKTATFEGNLSAPSVSVDDGALLQGRLEIAGRR